MDPTARRSAPSDLALSRSEKAKAILLFGAIGVGTALGFGAAYTLGLRWSVLAGLGVLAYVLGLRHGFDADHIAAIDNTTRKLLNEGRRPLTVGTWFSLGHSTVVSALIVALVVATNAIQSHLAAFRSVGGLLGTAISGGFLFVIGGVNAVLAIDVYRLFVRTRSGRVDDAQYEREMERRGLLYRYFSRLFRSVREPWQIYPIGVLFGLGFDTATEVALIAISLEAGFGGLLPLWTALLLPFLFTLGMVLSDTTDGFAMRYAYGWAFNHPVRKVYYNLTLTLISVLVAFVVGGIEVLQLVGSELGLSGPFWSELERLRFDVIGLGIVVLFLVSWAVAMAIYRVKGYEKPDRSVLPPRSPPGEADLASRSEP